MPRVEGGTGTSERPLGPSGKMRIKFDGIGDSIIEARENYSAALRLMFTSEDKKMVAMSVPLNAGAVNRLSPFVDLPGGSPFSEDGLRQTIENIMPRNVWWYADVYNGWVKTLDKTNDSSLPWVFCEPGTHRGYLLDFYKTVRKGDGALRANFILISNENRLAWFQTPWPGTLVCTRGSTGVEDYIGPLTALNDGVTMWRQLKGFGLEWERFLGDLKNSQSLYNRDGSAKGFLGDVEDISPALLDIIRSYGPRLVQWDMVITQQYGLGVKWDNRVMSFEIIPVQSDSDEFKRDVKRLEDAWNKTASAIMGRPVKLFENDGSTTDDGKIIIGNLWRPIVDAYPNTVRESLPDGRPGMGFPMTAAKWAHDGVAAFTFMAERLHALGDTALVDPTGLCVLTNNKAILPWVMQNVPEFKAIMVDEQGGEVL